MEIHPSLVVPPIDQRLRIPQTTIEEMVRQIVEKFHPLKVILFGSYAYGIPRPDSDLDLLVIMDTPLKETDQALNIRLELKVLFSFDLLVYTPDHLQQRLEWGDSFLRDITTLGRVVYESPDA